MLKYLELIYLIDEGCYIKGNNCNPFLQSDSCEPNNYLYYKRSFNCEAIVTIVLFIRKSKIERDSEIHCTTDFVLYKFILKINDI